MIQSLNDIFFLLIEIGVIESPTATFLSLIFLIEKAQRESVKKGEREEGHWNTLLPSKIIVRTQKAKKNTLEYMR